MDIRCCKVGTEEGPGNQLLAQVGDPEARAVDTKKTSQQKRAQKMKLGKSLRQYFSTKAESRRQEEASWDEDLIGDRNGKFGKNRVFWQGSLDSRGFPRAPAVEVRDIFRHCVREGREGTDFARSVCMNNCKSDVSRFSEMPYEEGFVHHGMTEAAEWATEHVAPVLKEQLRSNKGYRLTIVGHSLGAGVAALFTMMLVKSPELVGLADPREIRAILFAPPRVMSVDLALKYAPYVNSVIYQDDFLPRVSTKSVKRVFLVTFPLTVVVVFTYWLKQTLQSKEDKETQRLYPPGKVYHFIYKQPGRRGDRPIRARVVPSAEGRFERIVLPSLGTVSNHSVLLLAKHLKKFDWPEELKDSWLISVLQTRKK
nr:uncharacterized protein LOC112272915 isoform X5 [Physcomitrium patens]|eukprot:XP_024356853.1 uncharacterized protein LOC112272915 isoform X5 [Physcomitrella patens]